MQSQISERVGQLREWLVSQGLDALLIPHEDEFLNEYTPVHLERLHWATGFTGSAGMAVIASDKAAMFVDGRYVVQVRKEVPGNLFEYRHLIEEPAIGWLLANLPEGARVGVDTRLHSAAWLARARQEVGAKIKLVALQENPVDTYWLDRPAASTSQVQLMSTELAGRNSADKRAQIAKLLDGADAVMLTALDSICWLLNIRGNDAPHTPIVLAHALLHNDSSVDLWIEESRLPQGFAHHVGEGVRIHSPENLAQNLSALNGKKVRIDRGSSNGWTADKLAANGATLIDGSDPCMLPKAAKNSAEIDGMKACHVRDGVAMAKFLAWFDREVAAGNLHDEGVLADKLATFRGEDPSLKDLSFSTISAAGGNAAMCHYNHINQPAPAVLEMNNVYLVDSGGQYPDGTTDITRTLPVGECSAEVKKAFTLVLKGHISLASARFPYGTTGTHLDVLARQHLWAHGMDFDHGTGHGVGHYLSVHEGPQRIAKAWNATKLETGMVLSNEPGYYQADGFGIRIENLEVVVEVPTEGDRTMLGFESLTRAPIDKRLIDTGLMTDSDIDWLNNYHRKVWEAVSPFLSGDDLDWLETATSPLSR